MWQVHGRFDPVGFGDKDFFFRMFVDAWARLWIDDVNAPGMDVSCDQQLVYVTLDQ